MEIQELKENLKEIGLSASEATIYLTLLKSGESSVAEISQFSGLHRTNIYDSLEKLKEKGFVAYVLKGKKQFYRASDPELVLNYLKEKEEKIFNIIPKLKDLQKEIKEKVIVEVFKGKEGIKASLKDILIPKPIRTVLCAIMEPRSLILKGYPKWSMSGFPSMRKSKPVAIPI